MEQAIDELTMDKGEDPSLKQGVNPTDVLCVPRSRVWANSIYVNL